MKYITKAGANGDTAYSFKYFDGTATVSRAGVFVDGRPQDCLEHKEIAQLGRSVRSTGNPREKWAYLEMCQLLDDGEIRYHDPFSMNSGNGNGNSNGHSDLIKVILTKDEKTRIKGACRGYDGRLTRDILDILREYCLSHELTENYWRITNGQPRKVVMASVRLKSGTRDGVQLGLDLIKLIENS